MVGTPSRVTPNQLADLIHFHLRQVWAFGLGSGQVLLQKIRRQHTKAGLFHGADVILIFTPECLEAVGLVLCHRLVRVAYPDVGTL